MTTTPTTCPRCRRPESPDGCQRAARPDDMWAELDCAMESIARLEAEAEKLRRESAGEVEHGDV